MALSLSTFSDSNTLDASGANSPESRIDDVEDYVNFGIGTSEYTSSRFLSSEHIFKPEHRGSPAPMSRFETGELHWRTVPSDLGRVTFFHGDKLTYSRDATSPAVSAWRWIPGMTATIYVEPEQTNDVCRAAIEARCFIHEWGGEEDIYTDAGTGTTAGAIESSSALVAQVGLFVNNTLQDGSIRTLYSSGLHGASGAQFERFQFTKKEFNWSIQFEDTLSPGIYNIGFRIRIRANNYKESSPFMKHISIHSRSFLFESWYR